jgi:carbamoyl-phosphate synthase large subunit
VRKNWQTQRKEKMKEYKNILITSAGKRVVLTKLFKQSLKGYYSESKVFTTDMNPDFAPAGIISDGCFKVPEVTAVNYIDFLLKISIDNGIKLIVPTIDTELILMSENKILFQKNGIEILVSDTQFINTCRDKRNTAKFFNSLSIRTPEVRDKYSPRFPMFAKPYDGSLSKDIYVIKSGENLTPEIVNNPKLLFMEYIDRQEYKEYTVDMYYGRDSRIKSIVPRERLEIRAGEISKGYTRKNYLVNFLKERMDCLHGVTGCICVQLFYREEDNDVVGIEINPRFGGGYPLSYHAGADFPVNIIKEYLHGELLDYSENWHDHVLMLRYDEDIIVYE